MTKLNYECINGHKWKSKKWPTSTWYSEIGRWRVLDWFGRVKPTMCPKCKSTITKCQTEDSKQGARHMGFTK